MATDAVAEAAAELTRAAWLALHLPSTRESGRGTRRWGVGEVVSKVTATHAVQ